tara:strand:+ start:49 stop:327 length:279 start_codon:yes stop_codon:yes gene_type:complete
MTKNMIKECIVESQSWVFDPKAKEGTKQLNIGFGKYIMTQGNYMIRIFDANERSFLEMYANSEEELDVIERAWDKFVRTHQHLLSEHFDIMR